MGSASAAAVLVTGSGPQDRDENSVGAGLLHLSLFKVIAIDAAFVADLVGFVGGAVR